MSFTELFIRRPVLSMVVSLLILLLGAQGLMNLQVRQYPEVEETTITITTTYTGASADLIQGFISTPIAKSVSSAEGVDYVTTQSRLGISTVSVRMRLNTDPNAALTEVTAKVQQVRAQLPSEAEDPVIMKGTGQSFALMYITFGSTEMNPEQVSEFLTRVVQPRFATLDGVGNAEILGGRDFSMRVWLDPVRLAARGVTAGDVVQAINANNFLAAPGKTQSEYVAYRLDMQTTLQTPETFGMLPIRSEGDQLVRLRDVADVELGPESTDTIVSFNGSQGTFIGITPTPSANPLTTAAEVTKEIDAIRPTLPKGMNVEIVYDASNFISASIEEVFKTIGEAALIVVVVILLFLGSFRSVLIPIVTIPLSLIGVCFFLYALGYSINLLTLLAMVLAIGLVVDDAIVVLENIHRHIEEGLKPVDAAIVGMKEIFLPIVSMTITLAAVYAPIGFTTGLTGSLFREFAFTLAGSVIISGIVAVTLSPMMSSKLLKPHGAARPVRRLRGPHLHAARELVWKAPQGFAGLPRRDARHRRRSPRHHGVPVHQDVLRACAGRGSGRLSRHPQHAEIRDRRLHAALLQAVHQCGREDPRDRRQLPDRRHRRRRRRLLRLQAEGVERAREERGRDQAGDPEPPERECRRAGLRLRAAVSARWRRRPADPVRAAHHRRLVPGL